jgi:hypothetical protein
MAESPSLARTEQFVPVRLAAVCAPGALFDVAIAAHDGQRLIAA